MMALAEDTNSCSDRDAGAGCDADASGSPGIGYSMLQVSSATHLVEVDSASKGQGKPPQPVKHFGKDCWNDCHEQAGECPDFCGGGVCCKHGHPGQPSSCDGVGGVFNHECVAPWSPCYKIHEEKALIS